MPSLTAGTTLGPYVVDAPLGEGGMGEVYRARDTTLNRLVALKILPDVFAADPDRLSRFEREAQVLAQLNHPHIAQIYGFERAHRALAMELVDGDDLAARLARGAMPVDEALAVATQLADALEVAHEHGIVHRDLKPANIKVRADGTVKVLDFGLAKPASTGSVSALDLSPTITSPAAMTAQGMILGTAAYMAPEQARGKPVDRRADIWAFGCVLYEMLTGRRAFDGETVTDLLAAVVTREPDWTALPAATPPHVRTLLARCLVKDPRQRLRDMGDARIELSHRSAASATEPSPRTAPQSWWRTIAAAVVLTIAVGTGAYVLGQQSNQPRPLTRLPIRLAPNVISGSVDSTNARLVAISRDGRRLAFIASGPNDRDTSAIDRGGTNSGRQLYLQALDQPTATLIAGTDGARDPFFSPDGRWIGFYHNNAIKRLAVSGGALELIADASPGGQRGAVWLDDDTIIYNPGGPGTGIMRVPASGGVSQALVMPNMERGEIQLMWPTMLPDGDTLLFTASGGTLAAGAAGLDVGIDMVSLKTGQRTRLLQNATSPRYIRSGQLVYARDGQLWIADFDARAKRLVGEPTVLVGALAVNLANGAAQFDVADDGTLIYLDSLESRPGNEYPLLWLGTAGPPAVLGVGERSFSDVRLSPDASRITFATRPGDNTDVWIHDLARGTTSRVTFDPGEEETPVWSPDGRQVAFAASRTGERRRLYVRDASGGSTERLIWQGDVHIHLYGWTPDGATIIAATGGGRPNSDIWMISTSDGQVKPFIPSPFNESQPALSPDGRTLAYQSDESGRAEIYVQAFPNGGAKQQISVNGGFQPMWSKNGRQIVFRDGSKFLQVTVQPEGTFSTPRELIIDPTAGSGHYNYDVAADGRLLVVGVPKDRALLPTIVFNAVAPAHSRGWRFLQ